MTSFVEDIKTVHVMVTGYNGRGHVVKLPSPREDEVRDPISLPHHRFLKPIFSFAKLFYVLVRTATHI